MIMRLRVGSRFLACLLLAMLLAPLVGIARAAGPKPASKATLPADAFVTSALGPDGSIDHMKMVPVSPLTDFSFDFQDLLFTPLAGA